MAARAAGGHGSGVPGLPAGRLLPVGVAVPSAAQGHRAPQEPEAQDQGKTPDHRETALLRLCRPAYQDLTCGHDVRCAGRRRSLHSLFLPRSAKHRRRRRRGLGPAGAAGTSLRSWLRSGGTAAAPAAVAVPRRPPMPLSAVPVGRGTLAAVVAGAAGLRGLRALRQCIWHQRWLFGVRAQDARL
uniref:Uncharacterized protein n=1 Tax=Ixodes ricinus TaxID=34613 RepID=A0A147BJ96_IXORI